MKIRAFIFDVDGTIIDSMPAHAKSWELCRQRHRLGIGVEEILRRTTGRTGIECIRELMGREIGQAEALTLIGEKEADYRRIFSADFREIGGFSLFLSAPRHAASGLRWPAPATAKTWHSLGNISGLIGRK